MFRVWGKIFKDNHLLRDMTVCNDQEDTRTHKVFHALDEICYTFDLSKPIWLDSNIREFKRHAKTRFYQDSFVDDIDFDIWSFMLSKRTKYPLLFLVQKKAAVRSGCSFSSLYRSA